MGRSDILGWFDELKFHDHSSRIRIPRCRLAGLSPRGLCLSNNVREAGYADEYLLSSIIPRLEEDKFSDDRVIKNSRR